MASSGYRLLDLIMSSITDGVFTVDNRFRVTFFNEAAEEITGYPREKAVGRYCSEIFQTPICDQDCPLRQSLRTGRRVKNFDIDIKTLQGKRQTISVCTAPLMDTDGTFLGGVETFRDISTIKGLREEIAGKHIFQDIIAKSPEMRQIFGTLPNIAQSDATVLLQGRSGTGKELFANAIHNMSPRAKGPLVAVNCGALPDNLLESELFGHVKGAFTDAKHSREGRFQTAEGGTVFLDEIGDAPLSTQVKLLRVLETREVQPLGSDETIKVDVRVVAATNKDLTRLVAEEQFREDLFYRLNVILIQIPDLNERKEDIPLLVDHFVGRFNMRSGRSIQGLSDEAMAMLMRYDFPGNVRELENIIEHAYIISDGPYIESGHLPALTLTASRDERGRNSRQTVSYSLTERLRADQEKQILIEALERNFWNIPRASRELGIHRTTMWRKVKRYGIEFP